MTKQLEEVRASGAIGSSLQAELAIKTAYVPNVVRQLTVNVAVMSREQTRVLVTGAVALPGFVSLPRSERTLLFAVAAAGGISGTASGVVTLHRVRNPGQQETVNILDASEQAKSLATAPLQSGDMVVVAAGGGFSLLTLLVLVGTPVAHIGRITAALGCRITVGGAIDGETRPLERRGHDHFRTA